MRKNCLEYKADRIVTSHFCRCSSRAAYREKEKMASKIFKLLLIMQVAAFCICAESVNNTKGDNNATEIDIILPNLDPEDRTWIAPWWDSESEKAFQQLRERIRKNMEN
uniref:uncharacterized protein LOC120342966 n=1 Tax=Styela clava TaxID=7725 RepID=UPI001939E350|nr:uncharacterized protein LOC120342966 [Styela clava]